MNRLGSESSPYLRQHADNPVDWWPWGPDARAEAERRDVPILLSVGYSACHWCHVMAHESFEDEATAAVMNDHFVNVKVDREERPDVDAVYMEAVQALTGRGGWPMTVFLTPDGRPFTGGTYWPRESRDGMPGFRDVLGAVHDAWNEHRGDLVDQADQLTAALGRAATLAAADHLPGSDVLVAAAEAARSAHDDDWGGFGRPPKFPTPQNLDLVLRRLTTARSDDEAADRRIVETTLDAMASGGMHDHLGGGFARYSTDRHWVVPHFEKMLYDQSGLLSLYTHGFLVTGHERYRTVAEDLVAYVVSDLALDGGGVASAEDADSLDERGESVEGAFSTFTPDEVRSILAGTDLADVAVNFWEFDRPANFEGRWIPVRTHHRGDWDRSPEIDEARGILAAARARRPRPGRDDKVLTEWNAHWVAALAEAGFLLDRADWVDAAAATAEFLLGSLRRDDGRWLRTWQAETGAKHLGFAADHAALVGAFVALAEATGQRRWVDHATATAATLVDRFWDPAHGGLFTTADDGEHLVTRDKDLQDGALPSANSVAALHLGRLAALTGDDGWRERADDILRLVGPVTAQAPLAFGTLLAALDLRHAGTTEIVVTGDRPDLVDVLRGAWRPDAVRSWGERLDGPLWADRPDGAAYVCRDYVCGLPATTAGELRAQLDA